MTEPCLSRGSTVLDLHRLERPGDSDSDDNWGQWKGALGPLAHTTVHQRIWDDVSLSCRSLHAPGRR